MRQHGIKQVEIGKRLGKLGGVRESREFVGWRDFRHGHSALRQHVNISGDVIGRHDRLLLADEYTQADVVALRAIGFLNRAVAHFNGLRHTAGGDRIGRIGAGTAGGGNKLFGEGGQGGLIEE